MNGKHNELKQDAQTVLIVDDREENRYTARHALTRAGFKTIEASTGQEGLEKLKSMPDVVLLDVRLPDMLGYEVCRRIRVNPQTSHIPVLQLSATFLTTESKLYALDSGADAYLTQPVDPLILVATVRSLARLHQAEKQAQLVARQWTATFDALGEGVALIDKGRVQRCNRSMTELLGATYTDVEQSSYESLLLTYFHLDAGAFEEAAVLDVQVDRRFFRLSSVPLPEGSDTAGCILIAADVTPQKRAEQAVLLNERLAATGRMAHTIAHEINNPLEAITNLIYLVQNSSTFDEETREYLSSAAKEVGRISQISRQVLSFHREASNPVPVPIGELVRDVVALNAPIAGQNGLDLSIEIDETAMVSGFPARLRQMFANIIRNALEASSLAGHVRVVVRRSAFHAAATGRPAVRIVIVDRGTGIPAEHIQHIFEAFYTTKEQKGSGVGLWLSQAIVQEHGGLLQVRSSVSPELSGTVFSVLLPLIQSPTR